MIEARRRRELSREECLRLLGEVPIGRVVFTQRALPAVRPVNHVIEADRIIIRASLGTAISPEATGDSGTVVAYEADLIDPEACLGWSVVVVGRAAHVKNEAEIVRYQLALQPWATSEMDHIIEIRADLVTGFRLVPESEPQAGPETRQAANPVG